MDVSGSKEDFEIFLAPDHGEPDSARRGDTVPDRPAKAQIPSSDTANAFRTTPSTFRARYGSVTNRVLAARPYGRGAGVGRGLLTGLGLAVGEGLGVDVGVAVAAAVAVAVAAGVAVAIAVAVAVAVGVAVAVAVGVGVGVGVPA